MFAVWAMACSVGWATAVTETEPCDPTGVRDRVVLLGDAGLGSRGKRGRSDPSPMDANLAEAGACAARISGAPVVFLGDNSYGRKTFWAQLGALFRGRSSYGGLKKIGHVDDRLPLPYRQIDDLLQVGVVYDVPVALVPGNHDWYRGVQGVERLVSHVALRAAQWNVDARVVGHNKVDVWRGDGRTMIAVDTMWGFRGSDERVARHAADLATAAEAALKRGDVVLLASHHPVVSSGGHGHRRILGQDLKHRRYRRALDRLFAPIASLPSNRWVAAAGHDHHLEIVSTHDASTQVPFSWQIISGTGTSTVAPRDTWKGRDPGASSVALSTGPGFVVVDLMQDGRWRARLVDTDPAGDGGGRCEWELLNTSPPTTGCRLGALTPP